MKCGRMKWRADKELLVFCVSQLITTDRSMSLATPGVEKRGTTGVATAHTRGPNTDLLACLTEISHRGLRFDHREHLLRGAVWSRHWLILQRRTQRDCMSRQVGQSWAWTRRDNRLYHGRRRTIVSNLSRSFTIQCANDPLNIIFSPTCLIYDAWPRSCRTIASR